MLLMRPSPLFLPGPPDSVIVPKGKLALPKIMITVMNIIINLALATNDLHTTTTYNHIIAEVFFLFLLRVGIKIKQESGVCYFEP